MSGASRTSVTRAAAQTRAIDTTPQTVVGCVGVTERGPLDAPQLVTSYAEYQKYFGGPSLNSQDMDLAIKSYFEEGGRVLHVARVVHYSDATDASTKTSAAATLTIDTATPSASSGSVTSSTGPFALAHGDTLIAKFDGGSNQTATISATSASRQSASASSGFSLADGQQLALKIDGGSTLTKTFSTAEFSDITAATAQEVANSLNAFFASQSAGAVASVTNTDHVTITSNRKGTGSGVNVTGGTANSALSFTTGNTAGSGNVSNVLAVTASEIATIFAAIPVTGGTVAAVSGAVKFTSATTGGSSTVQIVSTSTADDKLGLDNAPHTGLAAVAQDSITIDGKYDGSYANALSIEIAAANDGQPDHFNLYVIKNGVTVERFFNLSMDSTASNYVETVINSGAGTQLASNLIAVTDEGSTVPSPGNLPDIGTYGPLTGGSDGLSGLADADYVGGTGSNGSTGLRLLDAVEDLALLIVPGRATSATHNGMVTYCETTRNGLCFAILDPPAGYSCSQMRTYFTSTASLKELSELCAAYYPRILVDNPKTAVFGSSATLTAPPSGAIAGLYARIDASKDGGQFEQPASIEKGFLRTARGLEAGTDVRIEAQRGLLFDDRINPILLKPGVPVHVDGARTAKSSGPFPSVGESRGVLFLQRAIGAALDPKRNQNNRPRLRNEISMLVSDFLTRLTRRECFASNVDAEAWYFDIGAALNGAAEQAAGNVNGRLGVALSKPGEFINVVIAPFSAAA